MESKQKIVIYDRTFTREELFRREEDFGKERAKLPFDEKIKILVQLQKLAQSWGGKKDVIVWKI